MIITVTLNTAIDKTLAVPSFQPGRRHRTVEQTTMPGGKGVNVARVLKTLGQPVIATGLAGGPTGTRIVEQLTEMSVLSDFVRTREESRTNTALIDPTTGIQTEINERGPAVSAQEVELFRDKLLYLARGAAVAVFVRDSSRMRTKSLRIASSVSASTIRVPVAPPANPVAITGWPSVLSVRATLTPLPPGIVRCSTVRWRRPSRKFGTESDLSIAALRVTVMIMRCRSAAAGPPGGGEGQAAG